MSGRTSDRDIDLLAGAPSTAGLLARSFATDLKRRVLGGRPRSLPTREVRLADVRTDPARLADYAELCGFGLRDTLPATWLHVLTFPLQMSLLSAADAPFSLSGIVHVTNSMTQVRPVGLGETLTCTAAYGQARTHKRGVIVDLEGSVLAGDEPVWRGTSAYLVQGGRLAEAVDAPGGVDLPSDLPDVDAETRWRLPADLGRRYAAVSGDYNPIHLSPIAAKAFGFPKAIIHGMWTHARLLAALDHRLPDAFAADVRFTKPILLPSSVRFGAAPETEGWQAVVRESRGDRSHLVARVTPAGA